jgi:DNA-binding NtrC family response regulator
MFSGTRVLVVDDEDVVCKSCRAILKEEGCEVETAYSGAEALHVMSAQEFDVVITDLRMPGMDGIELLTEIKHRTPSTAVILITGYSTIPTAIEATKCGAFDYIPKPFTPDKLAVAVANALEKRVLRKENLRLNDPTDKCYRFGDSIGGSKKMRELYKVIEKVAPTDSTVLIHGESGTGKELVAKAIHANSLRSDAQFVSLDCTALTESLLESELFGHVKGSFTGAVVSKPGLFEIADGGTFFLDEIGNVSLPTQTKLLRVLQEREFKPVGGNGIKKTDIRLITATNRNLEAMIAEGTFREELFYRLNVLPIFLPPLRKRKDDIPALVDHFLERFSRRVNGRETAVSPEAMDLLIKYDWPGNVRELENIVERLVVMADGSMIKPEHLPTAIQRKRLSGRVVVPRTNEELKEAKKCLRREAVREVEGAFVTDALERNDWNVTRAARDVGMQRSNLHALVRKYGLTRKGQGV